MVGLHEPAPLFLCIVFRIVLAPSGPAPRHVWKTRHSLTEAKVRAVYMYTATLARPPEHCPLPTGPKRVGALGAGLGQDMSVCRPDIIPRDR